MSAVRPVAVTRVAATAVESIDAVAVEEPLEVRVTHGGGRRFVLAVTLRTPGHDAELAAGLALSDGLLSCPADLLKIHQDGPHAVRLELASEVDETRFTRSGPMSAACGLCGKTRLDAVVRELDRLPPTDPPSAAVIHSLPGALRAAQPGFAECGGLHAAGLFTATGDLIAVREDVGRHNAVDKLVGAAALRAEVPLTGRLICASGRAGFELAQKAAAAGAAALVAVGAASSLAVELASRTGLTLVGFARDGRFTVYAGRVR
jgi:FdhD protein